MPDIHIHRAHTLGLARARQLSRTWTADVEQQFALTCTVAEDDDGDTISFKRSGISGTVRVTADAFELDAKLGLLLGAFSKTIESEITKHVEALLDSSGVPSLPAPAAVSAKPAPSNPARNSSRNTAKKGSST